MSICIVIINFDMKYIPLCISLNGSKIGYLFLLKGDDDDNWNQLLATGQKVSVLSSP